MSIYDKVEVVNKEKAGREIQLNTLLLFQDKDDYLRGRSEWENQRKSRRQNEIENKPKG